VAASLCVRNAPRRENFGLQHGAHTGRPRKPLSQDVESHYRWADDAYEDIRQNTDVDVVTRAVGKAKRSDGTVGFTQEEVEIVRQHLFFEKHPLADYSGGYELRRYDASPDIAEAWLRLRSGTHKPEDLVLLEHELAESNFYRANPGATYEAAHAAANKIANWESQIPSPTYEDFSRPWR
jgi:hypothetical protein